MLGSGFEKNICEAMFGPSELQRSKEPLQILQGATLGRIEFRTSNPSVLQRFVSRRLIRPDVRFVFPIRRLATSIPFLK